MSFYVLHIGQAFFSWCYCMQLDSAYVGVIVCRSFWCPFMCYILDRHSFHDVIVCSLILPMLVWLCVGHSDVLLCVTYWTGILFMMLLYAAWFCLCWCDCVEVILMSFYVLHIGLAFFSWFYCWQLDSAYVGVIVCKVRLFLSENMIINVILWISFSSKSTAYSFNFRKLHLDVKNIHFLIKKQLKP